MVKNPSANARDSGSIPGSGRSPGGGNGNPLQYACLGNPMDREARVHAVAKSWTSLGNETRETNKYNIAQMVNKLKPETTA